MYYPVLMIAVFLIDFGHKLSHGKFKKSEIISRIFSDHNAIGLEMNYRKKNKKTQRREFLGGPVVRILHFQC